MYIISGYKMDTNIKSMLTAKLINNVLPNCQHKQQIFIVETQKMLMN